MKIRGSCNKCPDDYVSVEDFYKVYGYACLYAPFEKIPITNLTITFVESRYPRKLIEHLENIRGYKVEETSSGIYTVYGDILPMQLIDSRLLSAAENLWLNGLSKQLDPLEVIYISNEVIRLNKTARVQAYVDAITKANFHAIEEAMNMGDPAKSLDEVIERTGLAAKWEERRALAIAQNLINLGLPMETIISATYLDPEKVESLYTALR